MVVVKLNLTPKVEESLPACMTSRVHAHGADAPVVRLQGVRAGDDASGPEQTLEEGHGVPVK